MPSRNRRRNSVGSYTRDLEHTMGDLTETSIDSFARIGLTMFQFPFMVASAMMGIPWSSHLGSTSAAR